MLYRPKACALLFTSIAVSILIGCGGAPYFVEPKSIKEPRSTDPGTISFENLFMGGRIFDTKANAAQVVIRSPEAWADFKSTTQINPDVYIANVMHYLDYKRQMAIGIVLGRRGSGRISVNIDSVQTQSNQLMVYASEYHPAVQTRDMSNPAHFIVLEKIDLPVVFAPVVVKKEDR